MMRLSTTSLMPLSVVVGSSPAAQVIQISNAGGGTLAPTVTSGATWVQAAIGTAAPCTGGVAGSCIPLTVTYKTAALAAGTYTAFLSVSDPNAIDSPQTVSVTVTIVGYGVSGGIQLYTAPLGTATAIVNTHGAVTAQPSTATGGNWLTVSLSGSGSFAFYYPYQITATAQSGQGPGTYTGSVVLSGSNTASDNATIPVTLNVTTSPIAQVSPATVSILAAFGSQTVYTVSVANIGEGSLSVTGATPTVTTGSGWLSAVVGSGGGTVTITADATSLQPGGYQGSVALQTNAANNAALVIPVTLLVTSQSGPLISYGGIVDNTGQAPIAPGDIAVAYGAAFSSPATATASALPLPTLLNGVQIFVNGVAAPLYYTSSGQIDFQLPYETALGTAVAQVSNNGVMGNKISVKVVAREPEILVTGAAGSPPIIVDYTTGGMLSQSGVTAHPGDTLVIYAIGLGQTTPAATDGTAASTSPLQSIASPITSTITMGGGFNDTAVVTPAFVGLTPGLAGLYQINVTIPPTFVPPADNTVPLVLSVGGAVSRPVNITVQ